MTARYALALAGLVTGLALAVRALVRARRQALTAAPSRPALGPYRAMWECYGPRACEEWTPGPWLQLFRAIAESMRQAVLTTSQIEQALSAMATAAAKSDRATPQIVARAVVSPPGAPVRETVLHLSPAAARGLEVRGELPGIRGGGSADRGGADAGLSSRHALSEERRIRTARARAADRVHPFRGRDAQ